MNRKEIGLSTTIGVKLGQYWRLKPEFFYTPSRKHRQAVIIMNIYHDGDWSCKNHLDSYVHLYEQDQKEYELVSEPLIEIRPIPVYIIGAEHYVDSEGSLERVETTNL